MAGGPGDADPSDETGEDAETEPGGGTCVAVEVATGVRVEADELGVGVGVWQAATTKARPNAAAMAGRHATGRAITRAGAPGRRRVG